MASPQRTQRGSRTFPHDAAHLASGPAPARLARGGAPDQRPRDLHIGEAGEPGRPLVVLLHGFPEFWWAWRHQITPLAQAGFHVVVPDMRGYNLSDAPQEVSAYALDTLAADVVGIADAFGADRFHLVGHDWGAVIGWWVAAT